MRLTATHAQRESFARWIRDAGVRVLLLRRDGLAWEVSKQRKKLTDGLDGGSHCQDAECAKKMAREKITLDPGKILELLDGAKQSWDHVEAWARSSLDPSRTLLVRYEDLVADTGHVVNATFRFLGVKPVQATSTFVKTSRGNATDLIANVEEVRAALNGTRWAF